jgi:hypothetical protein
VHTQLSKGTFQSVGVEVHFTTPAGPMPPADLFKAGPPFELSAAKFSHTEQGCLLRTIPTSPQSILQEWMEIPVPRARHCIFYDPNPGRDWKNRDTFNTGKLVAVLDLMDETDFIDVRAGVGTGTAVAELRCSTPVATPAFDFARDVGTRFVADFQFQVTPKLPWVPPVTTTPPAAGGPPTWLGDDLVFADSGIWRRFAGADPATIPACPERNPAVLCQFVDGAVPLTCPDPGSSSPTPSPTVHY